MRFTRTKFSDAWLIEPEPITDARGFFARVFCEREFATRGIETRFVQHSISSNRRAGTLRGLHYQSPPYYEAKVISCIRGAIHDVIVDLRPDSDQFCQWQSFELTDVNRNHLYIPRGFAHGFQTLADESEVHYLISDFHDPANATGARYDDPAFGVHWPIDVSVISEKDLNWPAFSR